jgi:putative serine protease PepD
MTRAKTPLTILAVAAAVAVAAGFASGGTSATNSPLSAALALQNTFVNVYKHVSPSVVVIQTSEGLGSGIVFDAKGDIVTNDHVVGTAKSVSVTVTTGSGPHIVKGTVVGTFPADDVAVVRIHASGLHPAVFADSSKLRVGDIAIAIGNPLGLSSSVSEGIVSALGRNESEGQGAATLQNAIQTTAAINPGNSGGALVNIQGQVIGIPTLAASDPQLGGAAEGIGFAIPSSDVRDYASQIIAHGHVVNTHRAFLGVGIADTGEATGVYITSVTAGGPAAKAGLKVGDLIVAVNGTPTPTSTELGPVLAGLKPGDVATIKFLNQAGTTGTVKVTLAERPGVTG